MTSEKPYSRDALEFVRAITFFDAIFAIALTLLITTLDDFSPAAWADLGSLKAAQGSSFLSFALSFYVIVQFWRASHHDMATLRHLDSHVISLSCVLMFFIVTLPFTTEALGKSALNDLPLPVALYAVNISAAFLFQRAVVIRADQRGLRGAPMGRDKLARKLWLCVPLPAVFLGSIPLAYLVRPGAAEWSWVSLVILIPLVSRLVKDD